MSDIIGDPEGSGVEPVYMGAMSLYPVPESVARARRWFRKFTDPHELACSVDDCLLMISELVTNAVLYGAGGPVGELGHIPGIATPRLSGKRFA